MWGEWAHPALSGHPQPAKHDRFPISGPQLHSPWLRQTGSQRWAINSCTLEFSRLHPATEHKHKHGMSEKFNFCPSSPMALEGPSQLLVASLPNAAQRGREWLRGTTSWLRNDWPSYSLPEWWRLQAVPASFHPRPGGVPAGFEAPFNKERDQTCTPPPCFTAGARPKFARSGHCRGCDPFFYLCSNRFLCCMVLRPGISGTGGRARIGGSDTNGRDNTRRVRAPPPAKSEPLDLWKEVQWEPGRSHLAQQFAELNLRTWF